MAKKKQQGKALDVKDLMLLAEAVAPAALSEKRKSAMRERILSRIEPQAPAHTITRRARDVQWLRIMPKVEVKVLRYDRKQMNQTVLIRLHPGAVFPGHAHTQEEECLVLEGEVKVGEHPLYEGDMHIAKPGCVHPDISTVNGALLLIRSEISELPLAQQ